MRAWQAAFGGWVLGALALAPIAAAQTVPRAALAIPTTAGASDEAAARDVLARIGAARGLGAEPLAMVRTTPAHGYVIVELARLVHGVPVVGAPVVVRLRPDRVADLVDVAPLPAAIAPWPAAPSLTQARAAALAAAPFAHASVDDARLVAVVHEDAVRAAFEIDLAGGPTDRARLYVDAATSTLLWLEQRPRDALGRVYPQNPTTDAMVTMDLPLVDLTTTTGLSGTYARVESCDQLTADCNTIARATPDTNGDYLYDPDPRAFDDAFAEVSAYFHTNVVVDYFRTSHGFTWTCGTGHAMDVIVNYSEMPHVGYENAMFSPGSRTRCGQLVFGQGTLHDFAYDGDVVYHEFGHAVTDSIASLGFFATGPSDNYQPLAINEGTSDFWAAAVQGDPSIGESIGSFEGVMGELRGIDGVVRCPEDLFGEGHYDGRIWSTFGWALRGIVGPMRAEALWYVTMASLSGGVTLAQATGTLLTTVASEVAMGHITATEQMAIMAAADERGLPDCTMFVPIDGPTAHQGYSGNSFVTAGLSHGLAPLQYTVYAPPDVTDIEVDVGHGTLAGATTVHFSNNLPVRATSSRITSTHSAATGRIGTAVYARGDGLEPCTTVYIGLETTDLRTAGESLYTIIVRVNTTNETRACPPPRPDAGPPRPDAGVADASPDAGAMPPTSNCGCHAASRTTTAWPLLALAVLLAARRGLR